MRSATGRTSPAPCTIDGAMLRYLNGNTNTRTNPNENYGRELQELFTIGKGPELGPGDYTFYTEADVKAAAKVLTGWQEDATLLTIARGAAVQVHAVAGTTRRPSSSPTGTATGRSQGHPTVSRGQCPSGHDLRTGGDGEVSSAANSTAGSSTTSSTTGRRTTSSFRWRTFSGRTTTK